MYVILLWEKTVYVKLTWLVEKTVSGLNIMRELYSCNAEKLLL